MKIKQKLPFHLLFISVFTMMGCQNGTSSVSFSPDISDTSITKESSISLKSYAEQSLKVGEEMTLIYTISSSVDDKSVVFTSSDEQVVIVDEYAGVKAIGIGEADVTIALKADPTDFVTAHFTVSKSFFMHDVGYYNGQIDFSKEDDNLVQMRSGQMQLLVNEPGQSWYFKVHLDHKGFDGADDVGRWGVGSFLVDSSHPIGDTMFWYGFRRSNGTYGANEFSTYWGGWRYASGVVNEEHSIDPTKYEMTEGATLTIIRRNTMHYFIWEVPQSYEGGIETKVIKAAQDVKLFEGKDTYPGVYSQGQLIDVSDYEVSTDETFIAEKLDEFQKAESVRINCIDPKLINGQSYQLSATVLPEITPNKEVKYSLYANYDGITLSEDGLLTIADGITGDFRIRAVSANNPNASVVQKFSAIDKINSTSELFEIGHIFSDQASDVMILDEAKTILTEQGDNYIPLTTKADQWVVTMDVRNVATAIYDSEIGLLSAKEGYMQYFKIGFDYNRDDAKRNIIYSELNQDSGTTPYALDNATVLNATYALKIIKDGSDYYLFVGNRLLKKYETNLAGATTPIIYTNNAKAEISNISMISGEEAVFNALKDELYYVGGYVNKNENTYQLAALDLAGTDMNWPPMNDYVNGLKFTRQIKGAYTISFTLSDIKALGSGNLDSKILVYLRSESTTCSVQLVIKGTAANPQYYLCPNFDDATWEEYSLSEYGIDFTKPVEVRMEKTVSKVAVYFNNIRVLEDDPALDNDNYDWSNETLCTPGIGTFKCGATISNPQIIEN